MEKVLLMLRKGPERKPVPTKVQLGWLLQVQERLEDPPLHVEPVCSSVCDIVDEVCHALRSSRDENARELVRLLRSSHLKALLETHDAVVERKEAPPSKPEPSLLAMPTNERMEAVRVVGLRRQPDEPLVRIRYSIINGMFENIEDVRMSESFHSKDKMIGKVFEHFWIWKFLNWIPQKVENIGLISIRSPKKVWLTNTSTKKCIYTLSEQLSQSLILVLEVYVRKSWIGFNTFARRKCHSRFINNSKRLLSTQCDDPRPRGFYDQSNVFFRRLKFQTLYLRKIF